MKKPMSEETKKKISESHKANHAYVKEHLPVQEKVIEVIKVITREIPVEVIREVEKPRLEGYELYAKLRDIGYYQGGGGQTMENPNGIDKVYIPTAQEVITYFTGDPEKWDKMRDGIIRAYIEINESDNI